MKGFKGSGKNPVFVDGNPKTGIEGEGDVSKGTFKRTGFSGYKPRGEGQGQRPKE